MLLTFYFIIPLPTEDQFMYILNISFAYNTRAILYKYVFYDKEKLHNIT